jgi:hypothetical protein
MVFQQSYSPVQWIDSETTYGRRGGGRTHDRATVRALADPKRKQ